LVEVSSVFLEAETLSGYWRREKTKMEFGTSGNWNPEN
jgi:hypothetical protein